MDIRDLPTNNPHSTPQPKRLSNVFGVSGSNTKTENVKPSPRLATNTTAPSSRLLAPTKASAAKSSPPAGRVATPTPPQPPKMTARANSKLPRITTPSTSSISQAARSKWHNRAGARIASNERATREAEQLSEQRLRTPFSLAGVSPNLRLRSLFRANKEKSQEPSSSRSGTPHSAASGNTDKALPSRPIASLANAMSPSKDSRSLLDATERPLQIQIGNAQHEWPSLTPHSAGSAQSRSDRSMQRSPAIMTSGDEEASPIANNTPLADDAVYEDAALIRSPSVLAAERGAQRDIEFQAHNSVQSEATAQSGGALERYPSRVSASEGMNKPRPHRSSRTVLPTNATTSQQSRLTRELSVGDDERTYSPYPLRASVMSAYSFASGASADTAAKAPRTASRIPLADPGKATLVGIKSRPSSDASTPRSEIGLNFGTRHVDAPGALQILDQGKKRREMQHRNVDDHASPPEHYQSHQTLRRQRTGLDRYRTSSPEGTVGTSESEEDEVTTPIDRMNPSLVPAALRQSSRASARYSSSNRNSTDVYYTARSHQVPPSNSLYTAPLEAIRSQAALPIHVEAESTIEKVENVCLAMPYADRQPLLDAHSHLIRRLSLLDVTAAGAERHANDQSPAAFSPNTKQIVKRALQDVQRQDGLLTERGGGGLDRDTRKNIDTTLSMLEGNGDAPLLTVDDVTLNEAFGHLRRDLQKPNKSLEFAQNAAAADEYLAHSDQHRQDLDYEPKLHTTVFVQDEQSPAMAPLASKWSESSTSARSPPPVDYPYPTSAQNTYPSYAAHARGSSAVLPSSDYATRTIRSISYPSRVPSRPSESPGDDHDESEDDNSPPPIKMQRRVASPEPSVTKVPGSVRRARQGDRIVSMGAQSEAALRNTKPIGRDPTPFPASAHRGRSPALTKGSASRGNVQKMPKTPRVRSKSRHVLKKMTGLFSARKDEKSESVPPVPRLDKSKHKTPSPRSGIPTFAGSGHRYSHTPPVVKMPTLSQPPPSSLPRSTSIIYSPKDPRRITTTPMKATIATVSKTPSPPSDPPPPIPQLSTSDSDNDLVYADADKAPTPEAWSRDCEDRAHAETDPSKKHRLLVFARALNDVIVRSREAQISAETALQAANSAKTNAEMAARGLLAIHRVAKMVAQGRAERIAERI